MGDNQVIYLTIILLYLLGMFLVGLFMSKKVKSSANYYTSDRDMNAPVTGFSYSATQMSAGTVMGMPSTSYNLGYNYTPGNFASAAAPWFSYIAIGERMRKICERIDAVDYGDVFNYRYGSIAQDIYSMVIILFYIPLIIAQFKAAGDIMNSIAGVPYLVGLFLVGGVIIVYTLTGGMFAVAWSDLIQGIIMMFGVSAIAILGLKNVGGFTKMNQTLATFDPRLIKTTGFVTSTWAICNIISWSFLQIGGSASAVVRFLIPKDLKTLRNAFGYSIVFQVVVFSATAIIGPVGRILVPNLEQTDQIVPILINQLIHPVIGGIVIAGIIAAMMSTVDSVLLICSSVATRGIYLKYINRDASPKQQLKIGRIATILIGVIALIMAIKPFSAIQWMVAFSFNVMASAFTVPILYSVWWPRASKIGGTLGMASGLATSLIWYYLGYAIYNSFSNWPLGIWPGVIGTLVSFIVTTVVSLMTAPPEQDIVDIFYLE